MAKYSKLIGSAVGTLIGLALTALPILATVLGVVGITPGELTNSLTVLVVTGLTTYFAPANG